MSEYNQLFTIKQLREAISAELEVLKLILLQHQSGESSDWMSTTEVMELLKIGRTTLHNRVKRGKITAYRDPEANRTYYSRKQVDAYIQSLNNNTGE